MEAFLSTRAEAIRKAQLAALIAGADPKKPSTHAAASLHLAALPAHTLVQLYVEYVLRSLSPELYCADLSSLMRRFRALHAGPFWNLFAVHLRQIQDAFTGRIHGAHSGQQLEAIGALRRSSLLLLRRCPWRSIPQADRGGAAAFPAGTGGAASGSVSSVLRTAVCSRCPRLWRFCVCWQVDRSAICVETLRRDLLCRRVLYDSALLHSSLAQLEFLSSLSLPPPTKSRS